MNLENLEKLPARLQPILRAGQIPGAAIAVVSGEQTAYATGLGYRDLTGSKPMKATTAYPIASTTKALNATLLGMLVEEGRLDWDAPVQRYLPRFRLCDALASARVTVRDLITMRTGLPRHDWVWVEASLTGAQLVERFAHLEPSADFRQRFQYSNLTVTLAGHIAEVITGKRWRTLVRERIFRPLGMRDTSCARPARGEVTVSYHENAHRQVVRSPLIATASSAPSGGAVYSTVTDMARWVAFNLMGGKVGRRQLIGTQWLAQIHAPQVVIGEMSLTSISPDATYALGWVVDTYNGHKRISHGGYLHDINSSVMFFPQLRVGLVCFVNLGSSTLAELINQQAFDLLMGMKPAETLEQKLAQYATKLEAARVRKASVTRTKNTQPSHPISAYVGTYVHPGYGEIAIDRRGQRLILRRFTLRVPLQHHHFNTWVAQDDDRWSIHTPHPFDRASFIQFHVDVRGDVSGMAIPFELELAPIHFKKQQQTYK